MSVIRPLRSGNLFEIFEVDTFVLLQTPAITGVTNTGSSLVVAMSDPNSGADLTYYIYNLGRSVDGGPFIFTPYPTNAIEASLTDNFYTVSTSATMTLPDKTVATTLSTTFLAWAATATTGVLAAPEPLTLAFDTELDTAVGAITVPAGTTVIVGTGATVTSVLVPGGHVYAYEVSVTNRYQTTSATSPYPISIASSFAAQTLAIPVFTPDFVISPPLATPVVTVGLIALSWTDSNTYAAGDEIEIWRNVGAGPSTLLSTMTMASGPAPTGSYDDAFGYLGMVPGTYAYRIRSVSPSAGDVGPFSATQSVAVPQTMAAPIISSVSISGGTQIVLTWTDPNYPSVTDEKGLFIYLDTGNTTVFKQVAVVSPGTLTYTYPVVIVPGQIYTFEVEAFNQDFTGPTSTPVSATAPLNAPVLVSVVPAEDVGAILTWTDTNLNINEDLETSYSIQRTIMEAPAFLPVIGPLITVPGGTTSFTDVFDYPVGTFVSYRVRADNATAVSPWSNSIQIIIVQELVAPDNVSVAITGAGVINVSWQNISPFVRGTLVYKSMDGAPLTLIASVAASVTEFVDDAPIISGAVYAYSVQNFDNQEQGPASIPIIVTTPFDPPQDLQVAGTPDNMATLTWTTNNLYMDYTAIETAFSNNGTFVEVARVPPGQTTVTVAVNGAPGALVSFRVREIKQAYLILSDVAVPKNLGAYSLTVSTDLALSAPTGVAVTRPLSTQNLVTWSDANTLATGFEVWRQKFVTGSPTSYEAPILVCNDANPALRSYRDTYPMSMGDAVQYWVYATDADNTSPQSNIAVFTCRMGAPMITTVQTARTQVTLTIAPPAGYAYAAGDQVLISRSVNGSVMSVIATIPASASTMTYVDNALVAPGNIGDVLSYSASMFSAIESGPNSVTVHQTLYDAVFMPLGMVNVVRTFGSRDALTENGNGVFAGCANGIVKVTNNPVGYEPILLTSSSDYAGTASIQSGDLTRLVAAGAGDSMYLIDAVTLARVVAPISTLAWSGASNDSGLFDVGIAGQGAGFSGNSQSWGALGLGIYDGWTFATQEGAGVRGIAPWDSAPTEFQNWDRSLAVTHPIEPFIALPFLGEAGASVQPLRIEAAGGNGLCLILQTDSSGSTTSYNTTLFQVQRSTNQAVEIFNIQNYVLDFVSDAVSKVLIVDLTGKIWLVDMSLVPSSASAGYLGYNPLPIGAVIGSIPLPSVYVPPTVTEDPVGHPGDLINLATGSISIELGGGSLVATALYNGTSTTVHVFSIPNPPITLGQTLVLTKTYVVNERVQGLAFDGGVFFYGRSLDTAKLFRFNAGI